MTIRLSLTAIFILFIFMNFSFVLAQDYTLKVTEEHPFFVNNEWVVAKDLKIGDELTTIDGKKAKITDIDDVSLEGLVDVYNLQVDGVNNYYAGNVLVHNKPMEYITYLGNSEFNPSISIGENTVFSIPKKVVENLGADTGSDIWILIPHEGSFRDIAIIKGSNKPKEFAKLRELYTNDYDFNARIELKLKHDPSKGYYLEIPYKDNEDLFYYLIRGGYNFYLFEGNKLVLRPTSLCSCGNNPLAGRLLNSITKDFISLSRSARIREFGKLIGKNLEEGTKERALIDAAHNYPDPFKTPDLRALRTKRQILLDQIQVDSNGKPLLDEKGNTIPKLMENRRPLFNKEEVDFILRSGICGPDNIPPLDDYFYLLSKDSEETARRAARSISDFNRRTREEGVRSHKVTGESISQCTPQERMIAMESGNYDNNAWLLDSLVFFDQASGTFSFVDPRASGGVFYPLDGWYYLIILKDGRAFIHPKESVVLDWNPYSKKTKKINIGTKKRAIEFVKDPVKSFVRIWFEDGRPVNAIGDYNIQRPGCIEPWKFEDFERAAIMRLDTLAQPEQGAF